jgi:hypothetical protein
MHHTQEGFTSLPLEQSAHKLHTVVVVVVVVVVAPRVASL